MQINTYLLLYCFLSIFCHLGHAQKKTTNSSKGFMLNVQLEQLLYSGVTSVREVDKNHVVVLSGGMWGQDYSIFKDWKYDDNLMFTCHIYHCDTKEAGIKNFLDYRTKFNLPFWMRETGHEPDQWIAGFRRLLDG